MADIPDSVRNGFMPNPYETDDEYQWCPGGCGLVIHVDDTGCPSYPEDCEFSEAGQS